MALAAVQASDNHLFASRFGLACSDSHTDQGRVDLGSTGMPGVWQWDHCLPGGTLGGRGGGVASPGSLSGSLASLLGGASWGWPRGLPSCSIIFTQMLPQHAMLKRLWAVGWKSGDHAWKGTYKIGHKNTNGLHDKIETPRHTVVP